MVKVADESKSFAAQVDNDVKKDFVLVLVNLLEALQDSHIDAKSYRTHCLEFNSAAQKLRGPVNEILLVEPAFGVTDEARDGLNDICKTLEDGLSVIQRCCQLSGMAKLFDHGATKERMEELIGFLNQDLSKANAFIHNEVSRVRSMKRVDKIQQMRKEVTKSDDYPRLL